MKKTKKLLAALLTIVMLVGMMTSLPVSAAGTDVSSNSASFPDDWDWTPPVMANDLIPVLYVDGFEVEEVGNLDTFDVKFKDSWIYGELRSIFIINNETGDYYYCDLEEMEGFTTWPLDMGLICGLDLTALSLNEGDDRLPAGEYYFELYAWVVAEVEEDSYEDMLVSLPFTVVDGNVELTEPEPEPVPDPVLQSISITPPAKTSYFVGESLDLTGMIVTAEYDISDDAIVSGWTVSPSADAVLKASDTTVIVSYSENGITKNASFDITVSNPSVTGITITDLPTKIDYIVGEQLDLSGMIVTASYNYGADVVVTDWIATPAAGTVLAIDNDTVLISYADKTASFDIAVTEPEPEPPALFTVNVSTPTIVETLSAYLNITVTGEDIDGKVLNAYLNVGGELLYSTPVVDGYARMFISAAPEAGDYEIVVSADDKSAEGSCAIEVTIYNTDIWVMNTTTNNDGYVVLVFNETIAAKDGKFDKEVSLNGKAVTCTLSGDNMLVTSVKHADLQSGDNIFTATGVKYPKLFPSYSFTFTAEVQK